MIDFHNHFLPGLDDGSKSWEMTIDMLKNAENQGVEVAVNTVHYKHPKLDLSNVNEKNINNRLKKLKQLLKENSIDIEVYSFAEVYYSPNMIEIVKDPLAMISNRYILIEFPTIQFPIGFEKQLYDICLEGIVPIIAHPERYRQVQSDIDILDPLIKMGCIIQIDGGSLIGQFGEKCKLVSKDLIKRGFCHIIGSDAHNNSKRNFCLSDSFQACRNIAKDSYKLFKDNPFRVINGQPVVNLDALHTSISNKKLSLLDRIKKKVNIN